MIYNQELLNPIYIGAGNLIEIYIDYGTDNQRTVYSELAREGTNSILLDLNNEDFNDIGTVSLQVFDNDTNTLLYGSMEYQESIVIYEDLGNYATTPKKSDEKEREIKYFKYLYNNDPLWSIKLIESAGGVSIAFKGNIKSQHKFLVEILDAEAYTEDKNDDVMNYFKEVIDEELYKLYFSSKTKSAKQEVYLDAINGMIQRLDREIGTFKSNLINNKYMTSEEIDNMTAGMNILEKYNYLREKNEIILKEHGIELDIKDGDFNE